MRLERRIFIELRSHWSYVCVLAERFELKGWKVIFRPEMNAIDVVKYSYDGSELADDIDVIVNSINTTRGRVRAVYDVKTNDNMVRWVE